MSLARGPLFCCMRQRLLLNTTRQYSVYEPPYLDKGPQVETYPQLNIRVRGYDYAVLESFGRYAHRLAESWGLTTRAWAVPARHAELRLFAPNSTKVQSECPISIFERTVQVDDISSTRLPLLLEALQLNSPEGVEITAKEPTAVEEDFRYVPDTMLLELKQQADDVDRTIQDIKKR